MKFRKVLIPFLLLIVFSSGCNGKKPVTTIDLAAETDPEELFTTEAILTEPETTSVITTAQPVPLEETATASPATTVYVSSPESTSYIPATESTVYVSTPESTVYITAAETVTETVYIEPATVEITQATTVLSRTVIPETAAVISQTAPQPTVNNNQAAQDYVLNKSSKKFHFPTCSSVSQMKDSNKESVHSTRDDIIAQGYSPCGRCKP